MVDFVHLHLHSEFSLLDGACKVKEIPKAAKALGQSAVAITDHGVMYGVVDFYKACKEEGVKPIIGCEVYLAEGSRTDHVRTAPYFNTHLVLLVENEIGYRNLIYMVSKSFTDGFYVKPRVDLDLLREHSEGLICLSGCLAGRIARSVVLGDTDEAERFADTLYGIFGKDHFYLELQDHGIENQKTVNETLAKLSAEKGYPLVATNDAHYLTKSDSYLHSVLMCIQTGNRITDGKPFGFETDEFYLKSGDEMASLLGNYPDAIANTLKIAERCHFDFSFGKTVLPAYTCPDGMTPKAYLQKLAKEGLEQKIADGSIVFDEEHSYDVYKSRMIYELLIIGKMGYDQYYLIVWDFIHHAKKMGIPVGPGRGSGAGSLIAYLIGITEIDSIKYDLLFERFLNPERVSMPDFDTDFCYNRREEVIAYVAEKYGSDHVAQITTFGTLAARGAVRDVGKALGLPFNEVDEVAKLIPQKPGITLADAMKIPELSRLAESRESIRKLLDVSLKLEGMPRHASTHAAGVVITKDPIYSYVPLSTNGDTTVTQFDMDTIASLGLLKFDFLALRYLTILSDAEREIRKSVPDFSVSAIPSDDPETYVLLASGKTDGLFQLESAGMRRLLVNLHPTRLEDIMVAIALYRPGPMDSIPKYLENRQHPEKLTYSIPVLSEILDSTCGCIIYQEQVMQICRKVAGFSYGRADIIRKAMSKKKGDLLENERTAFLTGAKHNLIDESAANELFEEMAGFAKYAFNKSHAAAYSVVSYRTAYLKAHYPAPFFAALLTSVIGDTNKTAIYVAECQRLGIRILPPDINESENTFTVSGTNIRYGLTGIRSVGDGFVLKLIEERRNGAFRSFVDFCRRMIAVELSKMQLQALISVGAFDSLGIHRAKLLSSYETVYERESSGYKRSEGGQTDLLAELGEPSDSFDYPDIPDLTAGQKLTLEKTNIGVYLSGSLLDDYSSHEKSIQKVAIADLLAAFDEDSEDFGSIRDRQTVTVVGIISKITRKTTHNGDNMMFLTLEDRCGEMEAVAFPKICQENASALIRDTAVAVWGEVTCKEEENPKILIRKMIRLKPDSEFSVAAEVPPKVPDRPVDRPPAVPPKVPSVPNPESKLYLRVDSLESDLCKKAINLLEIFCDGSNPVIFYVKESGKYIRYNGCTVYADAYLIGELSALCGNENVILK
ncbi:MAG: DNA polymerase III subunit alpha [Eubacteriales bacterium]